MSKRAVVYHFHKTLTDTSTRDSSGTITYPVSPTLPSGPPPPPPLFYRRDPRSGPVPIPLYCPNVDFRFVGYRTRFEAQSDRPTHSLAASLCRARTRPPLGHNKSCGTKNFLPNPSQSVGRFKDTMLYRKRRLFWNSSHENYAPLSKLGIAVSHASFSISHQRKFIPSLSARYFRLESNAFSAISL